MHCDPIAIANTVETLPSLDKITCLQLQGGGISPWNPCLGNPGIDEVGGYNENETRVDQVADHSTPLVDRILASADGQILEDLTELDDRVGVIDLEHDGAALNRQQGAAGGVTLTILERNQTLEWGLS